MGRPRGRQRWTAVPRQDGRTVVVTGASSGIGRAAARELALLGAEVAVVGRNRERTEAVAAETGGRAFLVDYDRLDSVRELGAALLDAYPADLLTSPPAVTTAAFGVETGGPCRSDSSVPGSSILPAGVDRLRAVIAATGALERVEEMIDDAVARSRTALGLAPVTEVARRALSDLVDAATARAA